MLSCDNNMFPVLVFSGFATISIKICCANIPDAFWPNCEHFTLMYSIDHCFMRMQAKMVKFCRPIYGMVKPNYGTNSKILDTFRPNCEHLS